MKRNAKKQVAALELLWKTVSERLNEIVQGLVEKLDQRVAIEE